MKKKTLFIGGGIVLAGIAGIVVQALYSGGAFRTIEPHFAGQCTRVDGVTGAEDITIDPETGIAYISAMDRRTLAATGDHIGGIYTYKPGSFETPVKMTSDYEGDFHPHGIDLWKSGTAADRLFVVNHPPVREPDGTVTSQTSQVDVFDIIGDGLRHVRSVLPDDPISLNDVAAAGPDRFYASIDQGSTTAFGRTLEVYGRLARSGVLFGDGETTRKALRGLVYANGVQMNAEGTRLHVAETTGKRLSSYLVESRTGGLALDLETDINSGLDNIEIDGNGTLWVASHPKTFDFLAHAADAAKRSPSQVFTVKIKDGQMIAKEIYLNDGNPISGASVAAPAKERFLIGSVFEPFILDCSL